jgi:hypothetical protein
MCSRARTLWHDLAQCHVLNCIVTCRPISMQRQKYAHAAINRVARSVFCVVRAMPMSKQRVTKHIPAEANARNNRSVTIKQRGKQALSTIQAVFSMGSVQSGYKRVEFWNWQFSWVFSYAVLTSGQRKLKNSVTKIRYQETSSENSCRGIAIFGTCYQATASESTLRRLSVQWFVVWNSAILL